jgi:hypothetical protein
MVPHTGRHKGSLPAAEEVAHPHSIVEEPAPPAAQEGGSIGADGGQRDRPSADAEQSFC